MQFCSNAPKQITSPSFGHHLEKGDQTPSAHKAMQYRYPLNLRDTKNLVDLLKGAGIELLYRRLFDEHDQRRSK